jgi:Fe2+ transport system protein B
MAKDTTKNEYKENPLKFKYGHHVHQAAKKENLKKELRDTSRLLQKTTDPSKKISLERKLEGIEQKIASQKERKVVEELQEKYKYIKFVEMKKVQRKLKKDSSWTNRADYINFYPIDQKYYSLFPAQDAEVSNQKRDVIQAKIDAFRAQNLLVKGFQWKLVQDSVVQEQEQEQADDFFV